MHDYLPMEPYGYGEQRRKNRQKRESADVALREHPDWSDGRIAQVCGVGDTLVLRRRRLLVEQGLIPASTRRLNQYGETVDINLQGVVVYDPMYTYSIRREDTTYILFIVAPDKQRHDIARLTSDQAARLIAQANMLLEQENEDDNDE